jgi:hypothetical protein
LSYFADEIVFTMSYNPVSNRPGAVVGGLRLCGPGARQTLVKATNTPRLDALLSFPDPLEDSLVIFKVSTRTKTDVILFESFR